MVNRDIRELLQSLHVQLHEYFPLPESKYDGLRNPLLSIDNVILTDLTSKVNENLLEISCDNSLKLVSTQSI
jgi:hypothetical protein